MSSFLSQGILASRTAWASTVAALAGGLLLLAFSLPFLGHLPAYDEMYHVLAARGLIETGQPVIAEGLYARGELYTQGVALAFRLFGESLVIARLPSLLAGCVLVAVVGAWTARKAGLLSGVAAAGFLAAAPMTIDLAVMARFYTLHALAVVVFLISGYEAAQPGRQASTRVLLLVAFTASLVAALHLQITTVVALGAGFLGVSAVAVQNHWQQVVDFIRAHFARCVIVAVAAVVLGVLAIWKLGFLELMGEAPLWAASRADNPGYYLYVFARELPFLFPMLPVAALVVMLKDRNLGTFCGVVVVSALLVHSISASKADRYVFYLLPFMSVLWGYGLSLLVGRLQETFAAASPSKALPSALGALAAAGVVLALSQEGRRTAEIVMGMAEQEDVVSYYDEGDWGLAKSSLDGVLPSADAVLVSAGVKGLYFLGDYDLELNASVVAETDTGQEFGRDERTGRRVIGTAESVSKVVGGHDRTLVVAENKKLGNATGVSADVVALLDGACMRVEAGADSQITAWKCER